MALTTSLHQEYTENFLTNTHTALQCMMQVTELRDQHIFQSDKRTFFEGEGYLFCYMLLHILVISTWYTSTNHRTDPHTPRSYLSLFRYILLIYILFAFVSPPLTFLFLLPLTYFFEAFVR